jgi:hypothetical protein
LWRAREPCRQNHDGLRFLVFDRIAKNYVDASAGNRFPQTLMMVETKICWKMRNMTDLSKVAKARRLKAGKRGGDTSFPFYQLTSRQPLFRFLWASDGTRRRAVRKLQSHGGGQLDYSRKVILELRTYVLRNGWWHDVKTQCWKH